MAVPSFTADNKRANKGVPLGRKLPTPRTIDKNLKRPIPPGPADYNLASPILMELPPRGALDRAKTTVSAGNAFAEAGERRASRRRGGHK